MKILFIDGHFTHNGWLCYCRNGRTVCGHYSNNTKEYFKMVNKREVITRRESEKHITIVKQKRWWHTFRILCHELMHWIFDILLPRKLRDKLDNWLNRD